MLVGVLFHADDFFNDKVQNGSIMHDNKLQNGNNRIAKIAQGRTYHNNYTCICFFITHNHIYG